VPELPEVETMVRGLRPVAAGAEIVDVVACPCDCRPLTMSPSWSEFRRGLRGQRIVEVVRRAKRVILRLDSGAAVVVEPRMTGLMLVADPPDVEHLRIEWRLRGSDGTQSSVWFWDRRGLGTVRLLDEASLARLLGTDDLGPDALEMTVAEWTTRCAQTRRAIKVALLDQRFVAGIGNLYASEILHRARIHPAHPAARLDRSRLVRLDEAVRHVLRLAIEHEGSTLGDGTYRNVLNQDGGYQNEHRVYDKAGSTCPDCGRGTVRRIVQSQRSTFFCAVCQRPPRPPRS
jgi:formamidopyrimidine-DNA glycosylase